MKKLFYISALIVLCFGTKLAAQTNLFSAGLCHTSAPPAFNPGARGCRMVLDTTTQTFYIWKIGTTWVALGERVDEIIGCAAPAYTPNKWQSDLVVNQCSPVPEMYKHVGAGVWECLNCLSGGATNLSWTEVSATLYRLNSSTGNDVHVREGSGVTAALSGDTLTFSASGGGGTVTTDATLDGDGSGGDPLKIAQQSAGTSQVLMWTGTTWEPSWGNPYIYVTTTGSVTADFNTILIGDLAGNITIGLPSCNAAHDKKEFEIKKNGADAFGAIIDPNSTETFFDGSTTKTIYTTNSINCVCRFSAGTGKWFFTFM